MTYDFAVGDRCVVRLDSSNHQKMGVVESVDGRVIAMLKFHPTGRMKIKPDGSTFLGFFTLIKHVSGGSP